MLGTIHSISNSDVEWQIKWKSDDKPKTCYNYILWLYKLMPKRRRFIKYISILYSILHVVQVCDLFKISTLLYISIAYEWFFIFSQSCDNGKFCHTPPPTPSSSAEYSLLVPNTLVRCQTPTSSIKKIIRTSAMKNQTNFLTHVTVHYVSDKMQSTPQRSTLWVMAPQISTLANWLQFNLTDRRPRLFLLGFHQRFVPDRDTTNRRN